VEPCLLGRHCQLQFSKNVRPLSFERSVRDQFYGLPGNLYFPLRLHTRDKLVSVDLHQRLPGGRRVEPASLDVSYDGQGSVTPTLTNGELTLSNTYTLTAKPATGWIFDSWVTAMETNVVTSYSNKLNLCLRHQYGRHGLFHPAPIQGVGGNL